MTDDDKPRASHIAICVEFLSQCEPANRPVKTYTTYGLKHVIEDWAGEYISELECVAALAECWFSLHWCGYGVTFLTDVDAKSIKRVAAQKRIKR
jgi:hypothetical protein